MGSSQVAVLSWNHDRFDIRILFILIPFHHVWSIVSLHMQRDRSFTSLILSFFFKGFVSAVRSRKYNAIWTGITENEVDARNAKPPSLWRPLCGWIRRRICQVSIMLFIWLYILRKKVTNLVGWKRFQDWTGKIDTLTFLCPFSINYSTYS